MYLFLIDCPVDWRVIDYLVVVAVTVVIVVVAENLDF